MKFPKLFYSCISFLLGTCIFCSFDSLKHSQPHMNDNKIKYVYLKYLKSKFHNDLMLRMDGGHPLYLATKIFCFPTEDLFVFCF